MAVEINGIKNRRGEIIGFRILVALFAVGFPASLIFGLIMPVTIFLVLPGLALSLVMIIVAIGIRSINVFRLSPIPMVLNYGFLGLWALAMYQGNFAAFFAGFNASTVTATAPFLFLYWVGVMIYGYVYCFRNNL